MSIDKENLIAVPDLAREIGTTRQTVHRWCRRLGIKPTLTARKGGYSMVVTPDEARMIRTNFKRFAPGWNFRRDAGAR